MSPSAASPRTKLSRPLRRWNPAEIGARVLSGVHTLSSRRDSARANFSKESKSVSLSYAAAPSLPPSRGARSHRWPVARCLTGWAAARARRMSCWTRQGRGIMRANPRPTLNLFLLLILAPTRPVTPRWGCRRTNYRSFTLRSALVRVPEPTHQRSSVSIQGCRTWRVVTLKVSHKSSSNLGSNACPHRPSCQIFNLKFTSKQLARTAAKCEKEVGPGRCRSPRRPTYYGPSFRDLRSIL